VRWGGKSAGAGPSKPSLPDGIDFFTAPCISSRTFNECLMCCIKNAVDGESEALCIDYCLNRHATDPCAIARREADTSGYDTMAFVYCVNGQKIICIMYENENFRKLSALAAAIVHTCAVMHEMWHWLFDVKCGPNYTGPGLGSTSAEDLNKQECRAYHVELACLLSSVAACGKDPVCQASVMARVDAVRELIQGYCGN
jgi:hypothetical protein